MLKAGPPCAQTHEILPTIRPPETAMAGSSLTPHTPPDTAHSYSAEPRQKKKKAREREEPGHTVLAPIRAAFASLSGGQNLSVHQTNTTEDARRQSRFRAGSKFLP